MIRMVARVVWMSVFADGPGGGNPCPVVLDADGLRDAELQTLAARFGAETVFVLPPRSDCDVRLRYFVPEHEMKMCVHATIGASVVLGAAGLLPTGRARIESPLGPLAVTWAADSAIVDQFAPVFGAPLDDLTLVAAALRIAPEEIAGPVRAASTARPKLMVPLRTEAALDALDPEHELLWQVCDQLDVTGFYPYASPADGADLGARQFPRRAGYVEDPATGVAAAALAAHLSFGSRRPGWHTWRIAQGRAIGRPSLLAAEAHLDMSGAITATRVGGSAREQQPDARRL